MLGKIPLIIAFLLAAVLSSSGAQTIAISGSSTVKPVVDAVAEAYREAHPDVYLFIRGGGSSVGIRDAGKHHVDIGMSSRPLKSFEKERFKGLKTYRIGYDAIVFIANKNNPASNLEYEDVQNIYLGNIRNWEELGGADLPIEPISKAFSRATLDIFLYYFDMDAMNSEGSKHFMQLKKQRHRGGFSSFQTQMIGNNGDIIAYVAAHPNALAYVSYGEAKEALSKGAAIKILSLDKDKATPENIYSGKYPLRRDLNLLMYDDAPKTAKDFVRFITKGNGRKVIEAKGYLLKLR